MIQSNNRNKAHVNGVTEIRNKNQEMRVDQTLNVLGVGKTGFVFYYVMGLGLGHACHLICVVIGP